MERLNSSSLLSMTAVLLLLAVATLTVYLTGGTQNAAPHLYYIPIISAAFLIGPGSGIATALAASLLCGPWMPIDVETGARQDLANWMVRGGGFLLVGIMADLFRRDINGQIRRFREFALHNPVTGLPNRAALEDRLAPRLDKPPDDGRMIAIVKNRITKFEEVVSTLGYEQGEKLMRLLGDRLRDIQAADEPVHNINHGRFAVIAEIGAPEEAVKIARRMLDSVHKPILLDNIPVTVGAHAGIAFHPAHGSTAPELLRAVAQATEMAVERNADCVIFDPEAGEQYRHKLLLLSDIRAAPRTGQLLLHYQPQTRLDDGTCIGVEALLRWCHPTRGMIPPNQFIPLAEATGLISPLTLWVARTAIQQLKLWREAGIDLSIAINLSARDLDSKTILREIEGLLDSHKVPRGKLTLEVTESAIMQSYQTAVPLLEHMAEIGCTIAIDDFGTGYSSLASLRQLPATILKLDGSFCIDLSADVRQRQIVRSTIGMAHELGLKVLAEGIETAESLAEMRALGCDEGQGYLISRPIPESEFRNWLSANAKTPGQPARGSREAERS
ncbi:MAG: bifunctional diguanylate cyclase/phosphodiesterase [Oceanibaculum nanhaiense]|uniref:putative bifunctional diguanylate cyclase/phosphodiesterase n=1 Tax=Oceanibaculum nanhaiense TaxID=1909734 RepID=UPI0025A35829|nr:bifunctional diguanylate cyclase/phosphodiesterase [Oceanibaculum nanhaiense]MDM7947131.1 bifunctional diguanylate cyclase/phosphodiesterase [Oceanibaculum nanhaiense]